MIAVLMVSLLLNVALGGLVGVKLRRRWIARHTPNDFAQLGAERFGGVSPGRVGLVGDSQAQNAPLLELVSDWRQYGIGGATIRDVASWVTLADCDELVVMAGTNDMLIGRPVGESVTDAERLLDLAARPVTWTAVPLPGADELNGALRELVESRGGRWVDVDLGPDWTDDGVHFNRPAYQRLWGDLAQVAG